VACSFLTQLKREWLFNLSDSTSLVLSYPIEPAHRLVVGSIEDLLWDSFSDPADLGKNVFS
jgi:hypothetical protein